MDLESDEANGSFFLYAARPADISILCKETLANLSLFFSRPPVYFLSTRRVSLKNIGLMFQIVTPTPNLHCKLILHYFVCFSLLGGVHRESSAALSNKMYTPEQELRYERGSGKHTFDTLRTSGRRRHHLISSSYE